MRTRLLLLAAALLAFGGSLASGFHFDDYAIFSTPALSSAQGWLEVWSVRQTRPLTYLTFWLNYRLGGESTLGYHALNLALHLAAVWLLYECLRRLLPQGWAAFGAAVFAVHPIQAEAVNYVWGRSIVLAALLCFAALWAWLNGKPWAAVAWFALALLAKEECVAFPLALLAVDRKRRAPIVVMLALSVAAGLRVIYATVVTPGAPAGGQAGITPWHYFLAQGPAIWRYLRLVIVPYGFTVDPELSVPPAWLGLFAWAALIACAVLLWRRAPWFAVGLALLLPSSSIFPAQDLAADRRMYLALACGAGVWMLAVGGRGTDRGPGKKRRLMPELREDGVAKDGVREDGALRPTWRIATPGVAYAIIATLIAVSMHRTYVWASDERLWREAVDRSPGKVRPKLQLSRVVPPTEALALLSEAKRIAPDDPLVPTETGKVLLSQGKAAAALGEFGRALALDPRDARNYNNRGVALAALGQTDAARGDFTRALAIDPGLIEPRRNLARLAR